VKELKDYLGRPFRPGQTIVRPYVMGAAAHLEERTVLSVEGGQLTVTPGYGGTRPVVLQRPHRTYIVKEPA
jgi:hypothetical protein